MLRISEGTKNDMGSLHRMNMKEITRIYIHELSDIGCEKMLQK